MNILKYIKVTKNGVLVEQVRLPRKTGSILVADTMMAKRGFGRLSKAPPALRREVIASMRREK
jgi:hypothetical protein